MALLFTDSFNHYQNANADMAKKWTSVTSVASTNSGWTATVPGGGSHVLFQSNTFTAQYTLPSTYTTGIIGCWCYVASNVWPMGSALHLFGLNDGATNQMSVGLNTVGNIIVTKNGVGTVLATSLRKIPVATWFHVELKTTINNTTGTYECRVDGSSLGWVPATTGANTRQSANNQFTTVSMGMQNSAAVLWWRGLTVADTSGSVANDWLGPCRVAALKPMSKGNKNQWTAGSGDNFGMVNEFLGTRSDSTYANTATTANNIDTFEFEDVPSAACTVYGLQHNIETWRDAIGARTIAPVVRVGSTDYVGATSGALTTSHIYYVVPVATNPAGGNWSLSDVNAAEFGYKLIS